jgi:cytochrome b561
MASLLKECRAQRNTPEGGEFADGFANNNWDFLSRANISDCDELGRRVDFTQCAWDDSWVEEFRAEYSKTRSFSFSFWIKPKSSSKGMPGEFWPSLNLFARLAPPFSLGEIFPPNGHQEIKYYFQIPRYNKFTEFGSFQSVDFMDFDTTSKWNFFYGSVEAQADGSYVVCLAMNGLPLNCVSQVPPESNRLGGGRISVPDTFLQGIEISAEALISPIEFTPGGSSVAQIQRKFYAEFQRMETLPGPSQSETDRISNYYQVEQKSLGKFDDRIVLSAPPILFQTRDKEGACGTPAIAPFLEAQAKLINATHCPVAGQCAGADLPDGVYRCLLDDPVRQPYYGLNQTRLEGLEGFADFLYTFADNSFIVRDGLLLKTSDFLDSQTKIATVWTLFLSPQDGTLVVMKLIIQRAGIVLGAKILTDVQFSFLGYLDEEERGKSSSIFIVLMVLMVMIVVVNIFSLFDIRQERVRWPKKRLDAFGMFEVVYDFVQVLICLVYLVIIRDQQLSSEESAKRLVERFAAVPFADPSITFSDKVSRFFRAAQTLKDTTDQHANLTSFGFAILILMLFRVFKSTAVHPRIALLTSSIVKAIQDLWHFGLLLVLVFLFFAMTACWMFADQYEEYEDLGAALITQFALMVRGDTPNDFEKNPALIFHIVFSTVLVYFIMLNFLLAIVVEAYMAVRRDLQANQVSSDFITDLASTLYRTGVAIAGGWPSRRDLANALRFRIVKKTISARMLRIAGGYPSDVARSVVETYFAVKGLQVQPREPFAFERLVRNLRKKVVVDNDVHPFP